MQKPRKQNKESKLQVFFLRGKNVNGQAENFPFARFYVGMGYANYT